MDCAICEKPGVGYWCSEEHQQRWFAQRVAQPPPRKLPSMPGAQVIWGVRDDEQAA